MPSNNKSSARAVLDSWTRALTLTARIEENPQRLLADVIQELADKSGEATALISGETCFRFKQLYKRSIDIAVGRSNRVFEKAMLSAC